MKTKPIMGSIVGLAVIAAMATSEPVQAQDRSCRVNPRTNRIECVDNRYDRRYDRSFRVEELIDRLYREVLSRRADRSGLRTYSDRMLRSGWDENRVRRDLVRSREARNRINQLYREILGRNADPGGLRTYQRHLERGWSLAQVRRELMNSEEARNRGRRGRYYYRR